MSTPSPGPQLTRQDVEAWLQAAAERRAALHWKAASPWQSQDLHEVFTAMSALASDALEEVRVLSESTRERSHATCAQAQDLRAHTAQLLARGTALMDRMAQFAPPPPAAIQEAESRLLALFKGDAGQRQA